MFQDQKMQNNCSLLLCKGSTGLDGYLNYLLSRGFMWHDC